MQPQDQTRHQIIGLLRFSCPCDGGFKARFDTPAALSAHLYDPARMAARFALFEALALPGLLGQSDRHFTLGVLIGQDMPQHHVERLRALIAPLHDARLIALPYLPQHQALDIALAQLVDPGVPLRVTFRHDDDDAVALDHIRRLRAVVRLLAPSITPGHPVAYGMTRGFHLYVEPGGENRIVPSAKANLLGIGAALIAHRDDPRNIYSVAHHKLQTVFRTLMDPEEFGYVRSIHPTSDSQDSHPGSVLKASPQDIGALLMGRFGLGVEKLMEIR